MIFSNFISFLTYENIFYISNIGVIPFWLLLIFAPGSLISKILVKSVVIPILLSTAYIFITYQIFVGENLFEIFEIYLGLEELYAVFSNEAFLLIFWLHFLSISLFAGAWIVRDGKKYFMPKILLIPSLILTYFTGPIGLVVYWFIRIFFAKKISFND